jgi:hypothetical protein
LERVDSEFDFVLLARKQVTDAMSRWIKNVSLADASTDDEFDLLLAWTVASDGGCLREIILQAFGFPFEFDVGLLAGLEGRVGKLADRAFAGTGLEPNLCIGFADVFEDKFMGTFGSLHHHSEIELGPVDDGDPTDFLSGELLDFRLDRVATRLGRHPLGASHEVLYPGETPVVIELG